MKKWLFMFTIIGLLHGCISYDVSNLDNLNGEVKVIGHGGLGFISWIPFNPYPSNSKKALLNALDQGADGIEVDLRMTLDSHFVLFHDEKLLNKTRLEHCIDSYSLDELKEVKYQVGFPFDFFQDEYLLDFESLLTELGSRSEFPLLHIDLRTHSDCKSHEENENRSKVIAVKLIEILQNQQIPSDKVHIISSVQEIILQLKKMNTSYTISYEIQGKADELFEFAIRNQLKSVTVKPKLLTTEFSQRLHAEGIEVITFGAKSKSGNKKLLLKNPDVIQTNNISALKELLTN